MSENPDRKDCLPATRRHVVPPTIEIAGWYPEPVKTGCEALNAFQRVSDIRLRIHPQPGAQFER